MTEQEAMIRFDFIRCALLAGTKPEMVPNEDNVGLIDIAIKALEEIQQYRAIGTVEELKESKEQYDIINCAAKSIQLSGLCDFENAKGKIISEIKRNYEYSLKDYEVIGTPDECMAAVEKQKVKKPIIKYKRTKDCLTEVEWKCPTCEENYIELAPCGEWCRYCGTKFDWSDEDYEQTKS